MDIQSSAWMQILGGGGIVARGVYPSFPPCYFDFLHGCPILADLAIWGVSYKHRQSPYMYVVFYALLQVEKSTFLSFE